MPSESVCMRGSRTRSRTNSCRLRDLSWFQFRTVYPPATVLVRRPFARCGILGQRYYPNMDIPPYTAVHSGTVHETCDVVSCEEQPCKFRISVNQRVCNQIAARQTHFDEPVHDCQKSVRLSHLETGLGDSPQAHSIAIARSRFRYFDHRTLRSIRRRNEHPAEASRCLVSPYAFRVVAGVTVRTSP